MKGLKKDVKLLWSSEDHCNKGFAADAFDIAIFWSGAVAWSRPVYQLDVDFVYAK